MQLKKKKDELKGAYVEQQQNYEPLMSNMASAQSMDMDRLGRTTYNFI